VDHRRTHVGRGGTNERTRVFLNIGRIEMPSNTQLDGWIEIEMMGMVTERVRGINIKKRE